MTGFDTDIIILLTGIFFLGGLVKGTTGMGLPLITVALGTMILPVKAVFGISIIPILLTNVWQVRSGQGASIVLKRFWPMVVTMFVGLVVGAQLVTVLDGNILLAIIGVVIVVFTILGLVHSKAQISKRLELPFSIIADGVAGVSGGLSTVWGPPITMFLMMTDIKKDDYIGAVGVIWFLGAVPLVVLFYLNGIIHSGNVGYSIAGCVPAMAGMWCGQHVRKKIDQETFRKVLLITLLVIGINLIRRAIF